MSTLQREGTYVKTQDYTIKKVYFKFLKLCGMGVLASTIGVVFDSITAGNFIGEIAISAISIANPFYLLSTMTFMIFSLGGATTCSQFIGAGDHNKTSSVFSISLCVGVGVAVVFAILIIPLRHVIVTALGASDPQLIALTSTYIIGQMLSMPLLLCYNVLMSFISLDGSPQIGFFSSIVVAITKIALDIILCAVLNLGIIAVALATGFSCVFGIFICLLHFKKSYSTLKLVGFSKDINLLGRIFMTGLPNAIAFLWSAIRTILHNKVLLDVGGIPAMTGFGVSDNISNLLMIVTMTFGYTMTSLLGLFYGEKDRRALHDVIKIGLRIGVVVAGLCAVLIFLVAGFLPVGFGLKDPQAISAATSALQFLAGYFIAIELYYILMYTYQSTKHTLFAHYIVLAKSLIFFVPLLYIFSSTMGTTGVWLAQLMGDWLCILSILLIVAVKTRKNPFNINTLLMLPESFNKGIIHADVSIFYNGESLEKFMVVLRQRCSETICQRTQEVAESIIAHGQVSTKKSFDIRVAQDEGEAYTTIRIRYSGKPFNVAEKIEGTDYRFALGFNTVVIPVNV